MADIFPFLLMFIILDEQTCTIVTEIVPSNIVTRLLNPSDTEGKNTKTDVSLDKMSSRRLQKFLRSIILFALLPESFDHIHFTSSMLQFKSGEHEVSNVKSDSR